MSTGKLPVRLVYHDARFLADRRDNPTGPLRRQWSPWNRPLDAEDQAATLLGRYCDQELSKIWRDRQQLILPGLLSLAPDPELRVLTGEPDGYLSVLVPREG